MVNDLLGINISLGKYDSFITRIMTSARNRKSEYVCVVNVHMLIEAHNDAGFSKIVNDASLRTPDGVPICWGLKMLHKIDQPRVAGMDLLPDLLAAAEKQQISVYFYGGTDETLMRTKHFLEQNFGSLKVAGMYSPPFRALTDAEDVAIINAINNSGAQIVFVALGCPKQERWMAGKLGKVHCPMIGIGGALPVMVGMQSRAPRWMRQVGLEWFYRLGQEPRRLFKRYAVTNSTFLWLLFKENFRLRLTNVVSANSSKL